MTLLLPRVTLYTVKSPCPLCDEARIHLEALSRVRTLDVRQVVIDGDPRLVVRHALRVPVIEIDGVEALHGKISRSDLEGALDRAAVAPPS